MPISLKNAPAGTVKDRLAQFRRTIPDEVGYSMQELAALPEINAARPQISRVCQMEAWTLRRTNPVTHRHTDLLVNPKTLAKYAGQTQSKD